MVEALRGHVGQVVPCVDSSPPDAFVPDLQWSWDGPLDQESSFVVPLVAKAGCMVLVATWNFLLLNRIIFRHRTSEPDRDAGTGA